MVQVDLTEAQADLDKLVQALAAGEVNEVIIVRDGAPVARLVPPPPPPPRKPVRIGVAKGLFEVPEDIDGANEEIAKLFGVEP
ncbi:MAG: prevent-host-death protein [Pseudomonadota bacterium]|jgi:antitoxin (DNA-binding transcriptional repressor) of toxin-antitoxin stability system